MIQGNTRKWYMNKMGIYKKTESLKRNQEEILIERYNNWNKKRSQRNLKADFSRPSKESVTLNTEQWKWWNLRSRQENKLKKNTQAQGSLLQSLG
jgi:hypothetical protein